MLPQHPRWSARQLAPCLPTLPLSGVYTRAIPAAYRPPTASLALTCFQRVHVVSAPTLWVAQFACLFLSGTIAARKRPQFRSPITGGALVATRLRRNPQDSARHIANRGGETLRVVLFGAMHRFSPGASHTMLSSHPEFHQIAPYLACWWGLQRAG